MNTKLIASIFIAGMISLFSAERYFEGAGSATALRILAALLMTTSLAVHAWRWKAFRKSGNSAAARCEWWPAAWKVAVVFSIAAWFAWQRASQDAIGLTTTSRILLGLWTVPLITALMAAVGIEWTAAQADRNADPARIARAGQAWTATGLLLCALVAINYSATRRDISRDWSYLKVTQPSEATINILRASPDPVTIAIFYPRDNEVLPWVEPYAARLAQAVPEKVTIRVIDKDADPVGASHFKTSRNGVVVLEKKGIQGSQAQQERMDLGPTLTAARPLLKKLDAEFQRLLMALNSRPKIAYVMRGHGELSPNSGGNASPLESSKLFEAFLRDQNWTLKTFGIAEGSASRVPDDATAVVVLGARNALIQEEVTVLKEFTGRGGSLLIALDPGKAQENLVAWLDEIGIRYNNIPVANDRNHVSATRSPVDVWFLFTTSFASHESIKALSRNDDKIAVLAFESGSFTINQELPGSDQWHVSETVRSLADSFRDLNRNYKYDEKTEQRAASILGVAASIAKPGPDAKSESKLVLFGDSSAFSDALIRNAGNLAYIAGSMNWIAGEQALSGQLADEEDVRIRPTGKQDLIWFYGSIVVVPLTVLFAGGLTIRANQRRRTGGIS